MATSSLLTTQTYLKVLEMPGSSLWLLPPSDHALNSILPRLIQETSSRFHSPHSFLPHVTLTSDISPSTYSSDPQAWLNSLRLPSGNDVQVKFEKLASEDVFVRKLYIKCTNTDGLKKLAGVCRQGVNGFGEKEKAMEWANAKYHPHLSLLYHDCALVDAEGISEVERLAQKASVDLSGEGDLGGWVGGTIALVQTDKPVVQWAPIAEVVLR